MSACGGEGGLVYSIGKLTTIVLCHDYEVITSAVKPGNAYTEGGLVLVEIAKCWEI